MKKAIKYLLWFVAGQIVQIVLQMVANGNYMRHPVLFCAAAGFLLTVCVFAAVGVGMWVAGKEKQTTPKSYREWAETEWGNG